MVTVRNPITRALGRWTEAYRLRRRRKIGERIMNELPHNLQRDIGWVPGGPARGR
ncbi:hypothetical protein [Chelativorans sp. J32]|uniref:hypothetical protein n=1 Tax=Chelativorans sp. J32 TaxID=935840 RepID=UPI0004ADFA39|nr:hypothetical protein [Chelativorans sp. J32]